MKRLLTSTLSLGLLACLLTTVSCGDIFVRGAIDTGTQSLNGTVSVVQFNVGSDGVLITIITLTSDGMTNTVDFCGDQRALFPSNSQVQVSFTPGTPCANVLAVHLI